MKPRILIVDDETNLLDFLSLLLEQEGYDVTPAGGLRAARDAVADQQFDLVLCDIMMPDGVTVDWLYVETVAWLSAQYGAVGQWGYTHAHVDNEAGGNEAQARFAAAGLIVRRSDSFAPGGAVVAKFERFAELRAEHGRHLFKCPAQLSESMTCAKCTLCWTRPELTVVFDPHGARAARIEG